MEINSFFDCIVDFTYTSKQLYTAGKLEVVAYDNGTATHNVVIVLVNGAQLSGSGTGLLQAALNNVYGQACETFAVSLGPSLTFSGTSFDANPSDAVSYTDDMSALIENLKDTLSGTYNADNFYLFVLSKYSVNKAGIMPFNQNFGFIFVDNQTGTALERTIAHEIGHGAFGLLHTFHTYDHEVQLDSMTTDNLMDYAGGTHLFKYQWDEIHEPVCYTETCFGTGTTAGDAAVSAAQQGTPVVLIADSIMDEGKVFVYNDTSTKIKVKFETSDTSKTKILYKLVTVVDGIKTSLYYPSTGYDTIVFNQIKEITLDSIPEGKYTLKCKLNNTEYKITFYIRKQKFEITTEQLKSIFPNTDDTRIEDVVNAINNNSLLFSINTPQRMALFIGQIGAETGGLKKLKESSNYTAENIFNTFLKRNLRSNSLSSTGKTFKYCDLVEGYNCTSINACVGTNQGQVDCDSAISVKLKDGKCAWNYIAFDSTYNVKNSYINSTTLFDYVYGCRMDNGAKSTQDGSTYLGKGFIHITGKSGYKTLSNEWNKLYPNDKKDFGGADINLLENDVEVAIKASMVYWELKNLNNLADEGMDEDNINSIGAKVNGTNPPNGAILRKQYSESAYNNLK
jgi:predicted chitinase